MAKEDENSKIVEFFRDSTVFLTGGTGFIGKIIASKLLLTCKVSRVYLLIRAKSTKSSAERLRELFEDEIFLHLKNNVPDCEDRIKLVEGDCSLENLGISTKDVEELVKSVDFVIHCAAAMSMMGSFKTSVKINIQGTQHLVTLANKFVNLKTFVHLSSLGTQWERNVIDEKLYESHLEYEDCLNLLKIDHVLPMDKHDEERITGKKITYYAMTKAAAENIFIREQISVPVLVFRFGLATPCWREPIPGWAGDYHGPNGAFALVLLDVVSAFHWHNIILDLAPVDLVVNALIAATHHCYDEFHKKKKNNEKILPFVYNLASKKQNNFPTFEDSFAYLKKVYNLKVSIYSNEVIFILWSIMFGCIPALFTDCFAALFGKKIRLFQAYKKLIDLNLKLARANLSFQVNDENSQNCWKNMNCADRRLFSYDLKEIVWQEYMSTTKISVQDYLCRFLEKNEKIRLAVFWIPKIRFALKVLYFTLGLYCVRLIYSWVN